MADDDLDILAWTMLGEAGGQGQQGMSDVAHVVLNRLNAGGYGGSIQDVALAPKQFSTWNSGSGGNDPKGKYPKDSQEFQRARQIAEQVIAGQIPGPPGRPLDYNSDDITPYWASSKDNNGTYTRNGHTFYPSVPAPPGELPEVGTLQDTRRTPSRVTPVTATPDMSLMRKNAAPSQLIPDTFARLPKPSNLGDSLGMNPVQGGAQQAPMFDAGFDERLGAMRTFPAPMDTQGMFTARSPAPPPVPAQMSPQMAGRRANDPVLQAALDARYPQTPQVSASDMARGRSGISTVASIPTTGVGQPPATRTVQSLPMPPRPQVPSGGFAGMDRVTPSIPDRLTAGQPGMPALYGDFAPQQVAQIGLPAFPDPMQPRTMVAGAAPPPFPMPRPDFMPQVATQLAVTPPAMPRPRPVPLMRPQQQAQTRAPLRITVNGANPLPVPPRMNAQTYAALNAAARGAPSLEDRITGRAYERSSNNSSLSSI
jgi:hypothetical protein